VEAGGESGAKARGSGDGLDLWVRGCACRAWSMAPLCTKGERSTDQRSRSVGRRTVPDVRKPMEVVDFWTSSQAASITCFIQPLSWMEASRWPRARTIARASSEEKNFCK